MFICPLPCLVLFCHQGLNDRHWNSSRPSQSFLPFLPKLQLEGFKSDLNIFFLQKVPKSKGKNKKEHYKNQKSYLAFGIPSVLILLFCIFNTRLKKVLMGAVSCQQKTQLACPALCPCSHYNTDL